MTSVVATARESHAHQPQASIRYVADNGTRRRIPNGDFPALSLAEAREDWPHKGSGV